MSATLFYEAAAAPRMRLISIPFAIFLGYCAVMCARMLSDPKPPIRISSAGIEDNQNGFGLIPWNEITDAILRTGHNRRGPDFKMILLKLRDPDFSMHQLTPHQRFWVRYKRFVGLKDACLDFTMLNGDPVDTLSIIRGHLEKR